MGEEKRRAKRDLREDTPRREWLLAGVVFNDLFLANFN
jgi:hypothetical protein